MKKLFKIIGILVVVILALAILLPILFKGKIVEIAKREINKTVNARIDFEDFSLSWIRSFPNFSLGISGLSVSGIGDFSGDTLAQVDRIDLTLDLMSVIRGNHYEIKKIKVERANILVKVLADGKTNYDIALPSEEPADTFAVESPEESAFLLSLRDVVISNSKIIYDDAELNTCVELAGFNHRLSGDLTAEKTILKTITTADEFTVSYEGLTYLSKTRLNYVADIDADLVREIYTLKNNLLKINELELLFDGFVGLLAEGYDLNLSFSTPKTDFRHFLSLIPAVYSRDFAGIQTHGKLGFSGFARGVYTDSSLPAFELNLSVENASFKYPDLPKSLEDIQIQANISNPGGSEDNTLIDVKNFHLLFGQNPFDMKLLVKTPVSDPDIKAKFKGRINLGEIGDFYPLEPGEELTGTLEMDINLDGKLSAVENEQYNEFTALGSLVISNLDYLSAYLGQSVNISLAQLNFSPQYLDLVTFNSRIGKNDLNASGKIDNYLAYAFKDEILQGRFTTHSEYFNLNDLMPLDEQVPESADVPEDTTALQVIEVPGNVDFELTSNFKKLVYDNLEMEKVSGNLVIRDHQLTLRNLSMNLLEGSMILNGSYNTSNPASPTIDFGMDIQDVNIRKAYSAFDIISVYAPIAEKITGKLSTKLKLQAQLGPDMMPVYNTLNGSGKLQTTTLGISQVNTFDKIGEMLRTDKFKNMSIEKILIDFEFADGKVLVKPFDLKSGKLNANITGWTAFDQTIDYAMNMQIPRSEFGGATNDALQNLVNQANAKGANFTLGETVALSALIVGTLSDPKVTTDLFRETGKTMVEEVKKQVMEEIGKKKEELSQEAREKAQKIIDDADAQAQKLIAEAEKQASQIRKTAVESAQKIRDEADKQAKKLEDEGKKKGFLAEAAAKESAKKVRKEGDEQADKVTREADTQANALVKKANDEAARIKETAQAEADKILKTN